MNDVMTTQARTKEITLKETFRRADVTERFEQILGKRSARFYMSTVLLAVAFSPDLSECTHESILKSALRAASLELSCDPSAKQGQLVPFNNRKLGRKEATLIIHYLGIINLAVRTGKYKVINYGPIREEMEVETDPLTGMITITGRDDKKSKVKGYFGYYEMTNGFKRAVYMTLEEIHAHAKKFSRSYDSEYSKWKDQNFLPYLEQKTVVRQLMNGADMSGSAGRQLQEALADDDIIDAEAVDLNKESVKMAKQSKHAILAELNPEWGKNPDPVKDATWKAWEDLAARADAVKVPRSDIVREKITEPDLQVYMTKELLPFVVDAEEQDRIIA